MGPLLPFLLCLLLRAATSLDPSDLEDEIGHDYYSGMTAFKKYVQGDASLSQVFEDYGNMVKFAADVFKAIARGDSDISGDGWQEIADPACAPYEQHYFRTLDGSCNWVEKGFHTLGAKNQPFGRDRPSAFADGYDKPRQGPNPRDVSNAIFDNYGGQRTRTWEHTPFLIGFVEFLVHDLIFSLSAPNSEEGAVYDIPIPKGDAWFDPEGKGGKTMKFWRNKKVNGTGVPGSPRSTLNGASLWMDLGQVYGDTKAKNDKIRSKVDGKLILDENNMLPLNDDRFNFHMWYRKNPQDVFVAGDPRANQDYIIQSWHVLWAREHNRICDDLLDKYPDGLEGHPWNDELLFLAARTINAAKFSMVGNAYFIAYFLSSMPWPATPFNIYNMYTGKDFTSPIQQYPWAGILNDQGRPDPLPEEFSVEYRWHDLLPDHLNLNGKLYDLVNTSWSASEFNKIGFDDLILAQSQTQIPDFHSGVHDGYRSVKFSFRDPNEGDLFDLVAWAIEHERERGIPPFNEWARRYDGKIPVSVRKTFEDFTSNPKFQEALKSLYKSPDEVDLYVGQELDETYWPHTHIPTAHLAVSFYTLFKGSVTDRFALLYHIAYCLVEKKPWNCKPTNVIQEILWKPVLGGKLRWLDMYWVKELDIINSGNEMLWRVVSRNTNQKHLQKNLFYMEDPKKNPKQDWDIKQIPTATNKIENSLKLLTQWGSYKPYRQWREKHGNVMVIALPEDKNLLLLSRINDFDSVFGKGEDPTFLARDWTSYIFETYGRIAGRKDGWGYGISNSEGWEWKRKRYVHNTYIIPKFTQSLPLLNKHSRSIVAEFLSAGKNGKKSFEPFEIINKDYKTIMSELVYSEKYVNANAARKEKLLDAIQSWLDGWNVPNGGFDLLHKRAKFMDFIHEFSVGALKEAKKENNYESWLATFATKPSLDGKTIDTGDAYASVFDMIVGNSGSGVFALNWGLWMLGKNPEVLEKLAKEVISVLGQDGDVTLQNIHKLKYLNQVTLEVVRSFPHGGHVGGGRRNVNPTVVETYEIPVNTTILLNSYWIQHHPRYWPNPDKFEPERFANPRPNPDYALATFGAGKMGCAGQDFAKLQLATNLAHLARAFKLRNTDNIVPDIDWVTSNLKMGAFERFEKPIKIFAEKRDSVDECDPLVDECDPLVDPHPDL